jgi:hypothetical protein
MAHRPVGAGSSFTFTAGAASTSSAFSVRSSVLRVVSVGGASHVAIGTNPAATTTDYYIPLGGTATLALTKASNRVVGITTGTTTIVTVPEGTQVPFGAGDYVSLSVTGQSYYDFTHQEVLSVNTTADYDGYYSTKMTVNYNSSGIVTAFSATEATVVNSHKISAIGAAGGSGVIHFQQVQISGDA